MKNLGKANGLEELIDIASQKEMMNWEEEIALKKAADSSDALSNNKEDFARELKRINGCRRYSPCQLCYKCKNKGSHLYVKCQICRIPMCVHTYRDISKMIKRKNQEIIVTNEYKKALIKLSKEVIESNGKI